MNENYKCIVDSLKSNHDILHQCTKHVKNVKLTKLLGEGANGTVYLSKITLPNSSEPITVAVKRIEKEEEEPGELRDFIKDFKLEVEYSYLMGEAGIGPKIYDAFYAQKEGGNICINVSLPLEHCLQIEITDNGIGRELAAEPSGGVAHFVAY